MRTRAIMAELVIGGILAVCVGLLIDFTRDYFHRDESARWPTASAVVTVSRVRDGYLKAVKAYAPQVEYRYTVAGSEHVGSRLRFSYLSDWGSESAANRTISALPVGRQIDVHYNPEKPWESVVEGGLSQDEEETYYFLAGLGLFFSIAFALMLWQVRTAQRTKAYSG